MEKLRFIELMDNHDAIKRDEFCKRQDDKRVTVEEAITKYARDCREDFREGIKKILNNLKERITKDSDNEDTAKNSNFAQEDNEQKRVEMKTSEADRVYEDLGFKPNLKYGPKSNLRKECSRFLRFAYLLDFVTMSALTNIYLNSMQFLVDKLEVLRVVKIEYEFDASKSQFGESKRVIMTGPDSLFILDAEFNDESIRPSDMIEERVKRFVPPPMGTSSSKDFDPIVHLELEEEKEYEEEEEIDILDESDEESKYKIKLVCPHIHKLWIKLNPSKTNFIEVLDEAINQGYSSLKSIERWSRHGELLKYVKVLESWDDKV